MKKSFYAYMSRLKHIRRWGLMRNNIEENVAEHSFDAALIAHALCIIKNTFYNGNQNCLEIVLAALYHEAAESITGDLPTPVKYYDGEITHAYKKIEKSAEKTLLGMLPEAMRAQIAPYVECKISDDSVKIVKAADKLAALIKCVEEKKSGNTEFEKAAEKIRQSLNALNMPEVNYFLDNFLEGYTLTLDELND